MKSSGHGGSSKRVPDPHERGNAANALIAVPDPRAEDPLLEALDDHEDGVRGMAALMIGSLGSRRAVPRLPELTRDADWFVCVSALNGLGYIDEALPAEPALVAIGDDEPLVRQAAALNMGGSSDPAAVDVLVEALLHDSDWAVREAAADALGEIGDPRAVESLRRAAGPLAGGYQLARRASGASGPSPDRGCRQWLVVVELAGKDELEAGSVRAGILVEQVTAVGLRVRLRDGEPQPGSLGPCGTRGRAPREPLEQLGHKLRRHAVAMVLDAQPEMPVALLGGDLDRRRAVSGRIHDQVRDDAVERVRVHERLEVGRDVHGHFLGSLGRHEPDKLMYPAEHVQRLRLDADPVRL